MLRCVVTEQDRFDFLLRQVFWKPTNWKNQYNQYKLIDVILEELRFMFVLPTHFPRVAYPSELVRQPRLQNYYFFQRRAKILFAIKPNESQYVKYNYSSNFITHSNIFSYFRLITQHGGKINDESCTFVHSIPLNNEAKLNLDGCNHSGNAFNIVQHKNKILNNWRNKQTSKLFRCHRDDIVGQPYRQRLRTNWSRPSQEKGRGSKSGGHLEFHFITPRPIVSCRTNFGAWFEKRGRYGIDTICISLPS